MPAFLGFGLDTMLLSPLLDEQELVIQFREEGLVTINEL
jgi:hypothetical protein